MKKMMENRSHIATKLRFSLNLQLFSEEGEDIPTEENETQGLNTTPPVVEPTQSVENQPTDRQFSRDEVTTIVKKRTARAIQNVLKEFGLENKEEISEYLKKVASFEDSHNKYGELEGKYNDLNSKYKSLNREHLYLKNNIIPEKYNDLDKSFTDDLTEEKLLEVLKNHPEFVKPKVVIPEKLGTISNTKPTMSERERAEKLLHVKFD